jgi:hypothetical protein
MRDGDVCSCAQKAAKRPGHRRLTSRLAKAWVLRVRALSRSRRVPLTRSIWTVAGSGTTSRHLGADLDGEQLAMLIAMLDGLRQAHVCRNHQRRTSALTRAYWLTIGTPEHRRIAPPSLHQVNARTALRACDGERHRSLNEVVADASGGRGGNETAGAILHETSPAFAGIGFVRGTVFFRTNDQNSSISTVERCRSWVRIAVKACACSLARRSHAPIVSYL